MYANAQKATGRRDNNCDYAEVADLARRAVTGVAMDLGDEAAAGLRARCRDRDVCREAFARERVIAGRDVGDASARSRRRRRRGGVGLVSRAAVLRASGAAVLLVDTLCQFRAQPQYYIFGPFISILAHQAGVEPQVMHVNGAV